jgi:hypothetical protein
LGPTSWRKSNGMTQDCACLAIEQVSSITDLSTFIFVFLLDGGGLISSSGGGLTLAWMTTGIGGVVIVPPLVWEFLLVFLKRPIRGKGILHVGHGEKEWLEVHTCVIGSAPLSEGRVSRGGRMQGG